MNKFKFELLLEQCRKELTGGRPLKDILKDHPAQAQRLEPLLKSILLISALPKPVLPEDMLIQGKNQLLSEIEILREKDYFLNNGPKDQSPRYSGRWLDNFRNLLVGQENDDMKLLPRLAIYLMITVLVGGFFTITASASSLPGDVLYGLKLNWEQTQLALAFSEKTKQELEHEFKNERLTEVESLLNEGREEDVEFSGIVEERTEFFWIVNGVTVSVGPETEIYNAPVVGDLVKVEAATQADGSLFALEISLDLDDLDDGAVDDIDDGEVDDIDDDSVDDIDDESEDTQEPEETEEHDETPETEKTEEHDETLEPEESDDDEDDKDDD